MSLRDFEGRGPWAMCTIAAKRNLALGRVVCTSFQRHHPTVPVYLLLADRVDGYFDPAGEPFRVVLLDELGMPELWPMSERYNQQEFSYALTPFLMDWVRRQGFERVLFLKEESLVTGDLGPVMDLLTNASLLLTPHLLRPLSAVAREQNILQCGTYNGGFVAMADTAEAVRFVRWWQERMATHCRYDPAAGMHFEQRWLDWAHSYVERVAVVRDPGVNVGHWNLPEREVTMDGEAIQVDGQPCRLFRFSGYDPDHPEFATRYSARLTKELLGPAAAVFGRYHEELLGAGWAETREWPYAFWPRGVPLA